MVNNAAVSPAPTQTSRQATFASGSTLKIRAKSPVTTANETMKFNAWRTASGKGRRPLNHFPNAANALLSINDTSRRKPVPSTATKDRNRSFTNPQTPRPSLGSTPQTVLSASWSWPKTPEAPSSNVPTAMMVVNRPVAGWSARWIMSLIAAALCSPTRAAMWPMMADCAASCPNTSPIKAITTTRKGTREKTV